jgi:hypothetical protein
MARAGFVQADIAQRNIVALINGQDANAVYIPQIDFEGSIKLTLGKVCLWMLNTKRIQKD